jgi:hypothetical protein
MARSNNLADSLAWHLLKKARNLELDVIEFGKKGKAKNG